MEIGTDVFLRKCERELLCYEYSLIDDGLRANDGPTFHQQVHRWMQLIHEWIHMRSVIFDNKMKNATASESDSGIF